MARRSVKRPAVRVRWEFSDTPYAQGMIVQTIAIAKDGATISENDLVTHEMELMTQVQEILGQSR